MDRSEINAVWNVLLKPLVIAAAVIAVIMYTHTYLLIGYSFLALYVFPKLLGGSVRLFIKGVRAYSKLIN
jgi:hypothetical protein